jgi:hypothetical protein
MTFGGTDSATGHVYNLRYDDTNSTIEEVEAVPGGVLLSATLPSGSEDMRFDIRPPINGPALAVGTYDVTGPYPDETHMGLYVSGSVAGCNSGGGTVTVEVLDRAPGTGELLSFAASWSLPCGGTAPFTGVVRYHSDLPYVGGDISPTAASFGVVTVGDTVTRTVSLTGRGSTPLKVTAAPSITGSGAQAFAITGDGCAGKTLLPGESCSVDVQVRPRADTTYDAALRIPDTSVAGLHLVPLSLTVNWPGWGLYRPTPGLRILDTRIGLGAPRSAVAQGHTIHLKVAGRPGVPQAASAVVLNLTVTGPTSGGYVTAFPTGAARPTISSINFARGWTGANLVTVPVGTNGQVDLFNCCGSTNLVADLEGWYAKDDTAAQLVGYGGSFQLAQPERLLDTRTWGYGKLPSHYYVDLNVSYGDVYNPGMLAMVVTVTALGATGTGYVTAYSPDVNRPTSTSTLNVRPGVITPNQAVVQISQCSWGWCAGKPIIRLYNGSDKPLHLLVDAVGFYDDSHLAGGLRFKALPPTRIVDTRMSLGTSTFGPATTRVVTAPDAVSGVDTWALAANVTAIKPTSQTFLTLWGDSPGDPRPTVSQLNPAPGTTVANGTVVGLGFNNLFDVYNSSGTTNVAIDVSGSFEAFPPYVPPAFAGARVSTSASVQARSTTRPQAHAVDRDVLTNGPQPTG